MIITSLIKNFKCIEGKHLSGVHLGPILWFLYKANLHWRTLEKQIDLLGPRGIYTMLPGPIITSVTPDASMISCQHIIHVGTM